MILLIIIMIISKWLRDYDRRDDIDYNVCSGENQLLGLDRALDSRTRTSTRFDGPFLARILEKFIHRRLILLFFSTVNCSVILVAGNWALLQIKKWQNYYRVLNLFCLDNIFAKHHTKLTTVSRFSRQNDVGLHALNVSLWENLALVVVLVLESKALYWRDNRCSERNSERTRARYKEA